MVDSPDVFASLRPRLFDIAYRMTGSVADAEDLCQDLWLQWNAQNQTSILSAEAFLVRAMTNRSIDRLRSAEGRRATYVGAYLPEPLVSSMDDGPLEAAELADSLTFAFLLLLDALNPTERAVTLLHDVFAYSFEEVATMLDRTPAACRQIASRTRRRLQEGQTPLRRPGHPEEIRTAEKFVTATLAGDVETVMSLLSEDVVQLDDGGPRRHAARRPVVGRHRVARLWINLAKRLDPETTSEFVRVNTMIGVVLRIRGEADMVLCAGFSPDGLISRIYFQLNPDKLHHVR